MTLSGSTWICFSSPPPACDTKSTTLNSLTNSCTCKTGYLPSSDPLKCTANCDATTTTLDTLNNVCVCKEGYNTVKLTGTSWACSLTT